MIRDLYYGNNKIVKVGIENGFRYYIKDNPFCPCAYIAIPDNHKLYGKRYSEIDCVECHGGLTYSGELYDFNRDKLVEQYVIGWDYGHWGDFTGNNLVHFGGKKWTIEEIESEIKDVIKQL